MFDNKSFSFLRLARNSAHCRIRLNYRIAMGGLSNVLVVSFNYLLQIAPLQVNRVRLPMIKNKFKIRFFV